MEIKESISGALEVLPSADSIIDVAQSVEEKVETKPAISAELEVGKC